MHLSVKQALLDKLTDHSARVATTGLSYVGLLQAVAINVGHFHVSEIPRDITAIRKARYHV